MKRSSTVDNSDPFRPNMRDSKEWKPTSYRSHTIGQVIELGNSLVGTEVTICGYAETVRGRGAICFLMLQRRHGKDSGISQKDNMDQTFFDSIQSASRESTIRVSGIVAQKRPPKVKEGESPPPEYEVNVSSGSILAQASTPLPVGVIDDVQVGLDVRLDNQTSGPEERSC